jgi:BCD family chlorophyll transporter-like MFS transporter
MDLRTNIRLGLLHMAAAMTVVPVNGVLNRVMIEDLGILASVVAALTIVPYALSPVQVWVGSYSDRHPILGYRRTPYIALGMLLCIVGSALTPHAGLLMGRDFWPGLLLGLLVFSIWGVGFNLASVAYLSLASDMSEESQSSRTVAVMWFMMICGVIATGLALSSGLRNYSDEKLIWAFYAVGLGALLLTVLGLVGLEPRGAAARLEARHSQGEAVRAVLADRQVRLFFVYLVLLLSALLGQDVLLEPFGARAFGMSVAETALLTPIWGVATLIALLLQGMLLSQQLSKRASAVLGAAVAIVGLLLIGLSGALSVRLLFEPGVAALGFGTGIATATNLGLMLDMTTPEQVGLFIGAWGTANALARGVGNLLSGIGRDVIAQLSGSVSLGYVSVFLIQAALLALSLLLLRQIDIAAFRERRASSLGEAMAAADAS